MPASIAPCCMAAMNVLPAPTGIHFALLGSAPAFLRIAFVSVCVPEPSSVTPSFLRSEEHTSELQSHSDLVCRLLLEKKHPAAELYCWGCKPADLPSPSPRPQIDWSRAIVRHRSDSSISRSFASYTAISS